MMTTMTKIFLCFLNRIFFLNMSCLVLSSVLVLRCCPSEGGQFLDCCSDKQQLGNSYCTYSPKWDCYKSGWPKCCIDGSLECPDEQPECEIGWPIDGDNYCTYSPDYNCYEKGFPSCCLTKDGDDCPENKPFCDVSCDADDRLPSISKYSTVDIAII
jgi:hypothetical protein